MVYEHCNCEKDEPIEEIAGIGIDVCQSAELLVPTGGLLHERGALTPFAVLAGVHQLPATDGHLAKFFYPGFCFQSCGSGRVRSREKIHVSRGGGDRC